MAFLFKLSLRVPYAGTEVQSCYQGDGVAIDPIPDFFFCVAVWHHGKKVNGDRSQDLLIVMQQ